MGSVSDTAFQDEVRDLLIDRLDEYEGQSCYGPTELAYMLLEQENVNGTISYSTMGALNKMVECRAEILGILREVKFSLGEVGCDLLEEPEKFEVIMALEAARGILWEEFTDEDDEIPNDDFTLTAELIDKIKKRLEANRGRDHYDY